MSSKKGLKEFLESLKSNKELAEKMSKLDDAKEIAALAKENGYEVTEAEIMDMKMEAVSGGFVGALIGGAVTLGATVVSTLPSLISVIKSKD